MIINHEGQKYEITNWDEFQNKLLNAIGVQIQGELVKQVNDLRLVDTGNFKNSMHFEVNGGELTITNTAPYAVYLEYGTFAYWDKFGMGNFPSNPDPKKKDISRQAAKKLPKGMQPFGVFRRVMWNQQKMSQIINKAVKAASK